MNENKRKSLLETKKILEEIDNLLDRLDEVDPYGDIVQNFEDDRRRRHTQRLLAMVNAELKGENPYEAEDEWYRNATARDSIE